MIMIKIYDTMSRDLREFVPMRTARSRCMFVDQPCTTISTWGMPAQQWLLIPFVAIFEYRGYEVAYISNFTDVDDKIINRAKEEGITPQEVADKYIVAFREDVTSLGVKPATHHRVWWSLWLTLSSSWKT